jgi:hypothetical protein
LAAIRLSAMAFADPGAGCTGKACSAHGELLSQRSVLRLGATEFGALLNANPTGQQPVQLAGAPACGVEVVSLCYRTVSGAGERTTAGAALMVPTGGRACSGPRPTVLYAHGTSTYRGFNIADIAQTDPANSDGASEGLAIWRPPPTPRSLSRLSAVAPPTAAPVRCCWRTTTLSRRSACWQRAPSSARSDTREQRWRWGHALSATHGASRTAGGASPSRNEDGIPIPSPHPG